MDRTYYVYAYFRLDGAPCYVGKGKGERWLHRSKAGGRNLHFVRLVEQARAVGQELPRIKVAEGLTEAEALQLEADLILLVGREANGGPLVNLTDGGSPVGFKWTPELNARNPRFRGKAHRDESRAQTSAKLKGRPKTSEHVANQAAQTGRKVETGWWSTEEGRAKQRANNPGHTGYRHSPKAREKIRLARLQQEARAAVKMSPAWANQNSVRYPVAA